ncbi:MAG: PAS domain-containing protein, partial [Pseudomonadota bacterium]
MSFCEERFAGSPDYQAMWERLETGNSFKDSFKRIRKNGSPIFIEVSYKPIRGEDGAVEKVLKFGVDVTEVTKRGILTKNTIDSITASLTVIEFEPDGTVHWTNEGLLKIFAYSHA